MVTHPSSTGTGVPALGTLPDQAPRSSPPGCPSVSFLISFNELLNLFPWVLWAPPANLSNLRSPWEPVICSQAGEQLWVTWWPTICDWHLNGRQFCTIEPLTGAICCYLQVGSVRIQLNCRTLSWGQRTAWCMETPTHLMSEGLWVKHRKTFLFFQHKYQHYLFPRHMNRH